MSQEKTSIAGLLALGIKFLKIFKSTKVLLAGASVASYGLLFSWEFAAILISGLVIHEYGHLRAMKRCGHKTKGIYLIPFVGGAAVSESGFKTRWEEVYIAMMGPVWGLGVAIVFLIGYYLTDWQLLLLAASFTALINAFNMLPVNPLDGGRVFKCLSFSINRWTGFGMFIVSCIIASIALFYFGMALFGLILVISILDFWFEWKEHKGSREELVKWKESYAFLKNEQQKLVMNEENISSNIDDIIQVHESKKPEIKPDLNRTEMIFSVAWYTGLLLSFVAIMWIAASTGIEIANIPALMINS